MDIHSQTGHHYQNIETLQKTPRSKARNAQYRAFRLAAVCIGVMCILQATLNIVLRLYFTFQTDTNLLSSGCNNQSTDQLLATYNNLVVERDQLQTSYNNLVEAKKQLQTKYTTLTREKDQLQTSYNALNTEKRQLQTSYKTLTEERDGLQRKLAVIEQKPGWIYFSSSIYYISSERRSWSESRQFCRDRAADLVIVNNRKEQEFIELIRRGQEAWIGLTDDNRENIWKWVDGSALTTKFWCTSEPNNYEGNEDCVTTGYVPVDGRPVTDIVNTWNDHSCAGKFYWICEKRISS